MKDAVYDFDMDESLVSETMVSCSREAVLLIDSSKLNKKSLFEITPLSNFSKVICDQEKPIDWVGNEYQWINVETLVGKVGKMRVDYHIHLEEGPYSLSFVRKV